MATLVESTPALFSKAKRPASSTTLPRIASGHETNLGPGPSILAFYLLKTCMPLLSSIRELKVAYMEFPAAHPTRH